MAKPGKRSATAATDRRDSGNELRLFIALDLPDAAIRVLENMQSRLRQIDVDQAIRWSASEGFHLTLKFLGDSAAEQVPTISEVLAEAVAGFSPFKLTASGLGGFPNTLAPRVIWAGLTGEVQTLSELQRSVEASISPLGFPTEAEKFSPHLTLGRARQSASRTALSGFGRRLAALDVGDLTSFQVDAAHLIRSDLRPSGPIYTVLASCPLTGIPLA